MIVRRYFQITKAVGRIPTVFVENFGDFGEWSYRHCIYRWEYIDRSKNIYWFIGSNLVVDYHHAVNELKKRMTDNWVHVNLKAVSNPINERKPAMSKRKK